MSIVAAINLVEVWGGGRRDIWGALHINFYTLYANYSLAASSPVLLEAMLFGTT